MKYSVGDLLLLKNCVYKPRRLRPRRIRPRPHPHLFNSYGIITEIIKHSDIFEKSLSEKNNGYFWFSQISGKEYCFYEDEVTGEII